MPDIGMPQDVVRDEHTKKLAEYFREPGQVDVSKEDWKKVEALYDIALAQDPDNPVSWVMFFDRSHPHLLEVGAHKDRLSNILVMAEVYRETKKKDKERMEGGTDYGLDTTRHLEK